MPYQFKWENNIYHDPKSTHSPIIGICVLLFKKNYFFPINSLFHFFFYSFHRLSFYNVNVVGENPKQ